MGWDSISSGRTHLESLLHTPSVEKIPHPSSELLSENVLAVQREQPLVQQRPSHAHLVLAASILCILFQVQHAVHNGFFVEGEFLLVFHENAFGRDDLGSDDDHLGELDEVLMVQLLEQSLKGGGYERVEVRGCGIERG